jgi:hypothetical protein
MVVHRNKAKVKRFKNDGYCISAYVTYKQSRAISVEITYTIQSMIFSMWHGCIKVKKGTTGFFVSSI